MSSLILSPYVEDDDFLLDGVAGADGTAPKSFRLYISKNKLRSFVARALRNEEETAILLNEFFSEFLRNE